MCACMCIASLSYFCQFCLWHFIIAVIVFLGWVGGLDSEGFIKLNNLQFIRNSVLFWCTLKQKSVSIDLAYMYISTLSEYVEEIFQEYLSSSKDELEEASRKLKNMTPAPMNTMIQKQPREEAIEKRTKRAKMVAEDVPPTTPGKLVRQCLYWKWQENVHSKVWYAAGNISILYPAAQYNDGIPSKKLHNH